MRVRVELEIEITGDATIEEVEEYLQFELGYNGSCSGDNPFFDEGCDYSVEYFYLDEI